MSAVEIVDSVNSDLCASESTESKKSVNSGFVMNAQGSSLKNVTFNLICPPRRKNPKLPLSLKKKRSV